MRVATILPVYNPNHQWLTEAINSVLNQKTSHDVDLFIRFDGNNFGYELPKSNKIFEIKDKYRRGLSGGLNFMFNNIIASSWNNRYDYFARIDADDLWDENKIEKQVDCIIKNKANICGSWGKIINEAGEITRENWDYANHSTNIESLFKKDTKSNYLIDASPIIDGRLVYDGLIHYNNAMLGGADYELWLRLSAMNFKICSVPERLYLYRLHGEGQNTKTESWKNTLNSCRSQLSEMYKNLGNNVVYFFSGKDLE